MTNASGGLGDLSNTGDLGAQNAGNLGAPTGAPGLAGAQDPALSPDAAMPPDPTRQAGQQDEQEDEQDERRRRSAQPDDALYARDPVCGKIVKKTETPYFTLPQGAASHVAYFDSAECQRSYEQNPLQYAANT